MIRATATYTLAHEGSTKETLAVEVATDATYSPDLLDDMTARAQASLHRVYLETWPVEPVTP